MGEWNRQSTVLSHIKVQEFVAYFQPCCKRDGGLLSLPGQDFLCLPDNYVPAIWLQVKVVLTPKPSRTSYTRPRDFRPISLISFLLKSMERPVDRILVS